MTRSGRGTTAEPGPPTCRALVVGTEHGAAVGRRGGADHEGRPPVLISPRGCWSGHSRRGGELVDGADDPQAEQRLELALVVDAPVPAIRTSSSRIETVAPDEAASARAERQRLDPRQAGGAAAGPGRRPGPPCRWRHSRPPPAGRPAGRRGAAAEPCASSAFARVRGADGRARGARLGNGARRRRPASSAARPPCRTARSSSSCSARKCSTSTAPSPRPPPASCHGRRC